MQKLRSPVRIEWRGVNPLRHGALVLAAALGSSAASANDWEWSVTPYLWAISTELSTAVDLPPDGQQKFGDILDKLDFAAQVHVEGSGGRWGFLVDATTLHTSDRTTRNEFDVKSDATTTLVEAAAVLTGGDPETGAVDLIFGARILGVELDLTVRDGEGGDVVATPALDDTLTDAMFGVRYRTMLNDRWSFSARADAASGDTDFTSNLSLVLGRNIGKRGTLRVGYRYLDVQFERGKELLDPSLTISGPMVGYSFNF
jgi:hypothetical protein